MLAATTSIHFNCWSNPHHAHNAFPIHQMYTNNVQSSVTITGEYNSKIVQFKIV